MFSVSLKDFLQKSALNVRNLKLLSIFPIKLAFRETLPSVGFTSNRSMKLSWLYLCRKKVSLDTHSNLIATIRAVSKRKASWLQMLIVGFASTHTHLDDMSTALNICITIKIFLLDAGYCLPNDNGRWSNSVDDKLSWESPLDIFADFHLSNETLSLISKSVLFLSFNRHRLALPSIHFTFPHMTLHGEEFGMKDTFRMKKKTIHSYCYLCLEEKRGQISTAINVRIPSNPHRLCSCRNSFINFSNS